MRSLDLVVLQAVATLVCLSVYIRASVVLETSPHSISHLQNSASQSALKSWPDTEQSSMKTVLHVKITFLFYTYVTNNSDVNDNKVV